MSGVFKLRAVLPCGKVVERTAYNTPTHEGLRLMLDVSANDGIVSPPGPNPSPTQWRFGFVETVGFTTFSQDDVLTSHAGWTETDPVGGRFIAGAPRAVGAGDDLSSVKTFTKVYGLTTTAVTTRGMFLATTNDDSGFLWATADFIEGPINLPVGTDLTVIYSTTLNS